MSDQFVHSGDLHPRPGVLKAWEKVKHRHVWWFAECFAEFLGVFIYTFAGTGPTFVFNLSNIIKLNNVGSLFGIGLSYAIGIILAISICAPVSGAHLSPGITIAATLFNGFPPLKALRYIIAQILGAFVACFVVYAQYHDQITSLTKALEAEGVLDQINFTPQGIAGTFALFAPANSSLRYVFLNEFICTFILGMVIWACIDHSNFYVPTSFISVVIGLGYATIIWGFAPIGLAANTARDVGGRMMAVAIWGSKANGGAYAAIAALTNIVTACLSLLVYQTLFADSSRVVSPDHHLRLQAQAAELEYRTGNPPTHIVSKRYGSSDKVTEPIP